MPTQPAQQRTRQGRAVTRTVLPALLVGLFSSAVSVAGSWIPNLWGDEAASLLSAERSLPSLWSMIGRVDAVHALYYAFLHGWISMFGDAPFSLRFPSAIAAGIASAGVVVLVRRYGSLLLAAAAGLACAILPRMTYAGEEARSFAMSAAIAVWMTVVLVAALRRSRPRDPLWIAYGVLMAVGIHLFLYLALVPLAHAASLALLRVSRAAWRSWVVTAAIAGAVSLPFVVFAATEHSQIAFLAHRDDASLPIVLRAAFFSSVPLSVVGWGFAIIAVIGFVVRRVRHERWTPPDSLAAVVLPWAIGPLIVLELLNSVVPSFTSRYLTMSAPAVAIVVVLGAREIVVLVRDRLARGRRLAIVAGAAVVAVLAGLTAPVWAEQRTPYAKNNSDWLQISETIGAEARRGDAIVFDEGVRPSRKTRLAMRAYPAGFAKVRDVSLAEPYYEVRNWADETLPIDRVIECGRLADASRVWVVEYATAHSIDTYGRAEIEAAGFVLAGSVREHSSEIYLYERGATPVGSPVKTPTPAHCAEDVSDE